MFSAQGYDVIRSDRIGHKGGLLTLVRHAVEYPIVANRQNIEEISTANGKLTIVNAYLAQTTDK